MRVVEQVVDRSPEKHAVAHEDGEIRREARVEGTLGVGGAKLCSRSLQEATDVDSLDAKRRHGPERRLAVSERKTRRVQDVVDDSLELGEVLRDLTQQLASRLDIALRGKVDGDVDPRERRTKLVRYVRKELPFGSKEAGHTVGHLVECDGDFAELVVSMHAHAGVEMTGAEGVCRLGQAT